MPDFEYIAPERVPDFLPTRPVASSEARGWHGVVLQRYRHPPSTIDVPPVRDHALVVNLSGPTLVEERRDDGRPARRWTDDGQFSLTPAGQSVARVLKGRPDIAIIHIAPSVVDEVAEAVYDVDPSKMQLSPCLAEPDRNITTLGKMLLTEAEGSMAVPGSALAADMLTRSLAVQLVRHYCSLAPRQPGYPSSLPDGRLRRLIDHMQSHLDEDLTLDRLASVAGLSSSQFVRAFRGSTGASPHHYLIGMRMQRARELLEHSPLAITEIAFQCGFEQPSHFASTFRKAVGMSPRAWRIQRRA